MTDIFPCSVCNRNVVHDAIECSLCKLWVHRKCALLTKKELNRLDKCNCDWYCPNCIKIWPFYNIDDEELNFMLSDICHL